MGDICPWLSSLPPVDDGSDTTSGSNEWREPSSCASSSDTSSECEKEEGLTLIDPPLPADYNSDLSISDNTAGEEDVTVPLRRSARMNDQPSLSLM